MKTILLGKTGIQAVSPAFGALPIQRVEMAEAVAILRRAVEGGVNFFDTANAYTDSEEKLGAAFAGLRDRVILATKSGGRDKKTVAAHIDKSLKRLQTDHIDLFQFHMVSEIPDPEDPQGAFAAALEAKAAGKILHIGVTTHSIELAFKLAQSGLFETLQFPFSYLSGPQEMELLRVCREENVGFIAMKALAGGLLTNARACHAFMATQEGVLPIWGVQRMDELEEWLALAEESPALDEALLSVIEADKRELSGGFCRGCGYCEPCPAGIEIHSCARMNMLLRRAPWKPLLSEAWREKMHRITDCQHCGQCLRKCPYGLDASKLLPAMLEDYDAFYAEHKALL